MLKKSIKLSALALSVVFSSVSWSSAKVETIKQFSDLRAYVQKAVNQNGAEHTLLVFDDDDTLLEMPQALGGVGWWDWQSKLLEENPESGDLVSDTFKGLLRAQSFLYGISNMSLVSKYAPELLKSWQNEGITTMVLSARGPGMNSSTLRQLSVSGLANGFKEHGVEMMNGTTSLPGSFYPCGDTSKRLVSYEDGVYSGSGQDKGDLLRCLLERSGQTKRYTFIILIDDTLKNDQQFVKAYQGISGVDVYALHYTKLEGLKEAQRTSHQLHTQMIESWNKIKSSLGDVLVKPAL